MTSKDRAARRAAARQNVETQEAEGATETPEEPAASLTAAELFTNETLAMAGLVAMIERNYGQINTNQAIQILNSTLQYHLTRTQLRANQPFQPTYATAEEAPDAPQE